MLCAAFLVLGIARAAQAQTETATWGQCKNENYRFDLTVAVTACTELINSTTEQSQLAMALTYRGTAYTDQHNFSGAMDDFDRAISLNPRFPLAFNNRGLVFASQGDFVRAMADFNQATTIDPQFAPAYSNRGLIYHYEHDDAHAIAELNQAIRLVPRSALDFNNRSLAYTGAHDPAHAIADSNEAIRLQPNNPTWLNTRCWARAVWGQELDRALADCDASIAIQSDPSTLDTRGLVHLRRGEFQAAFDDFDAALRSNSALTTSLYGRGVALMRLGRVADGQADILAATQRDQDVRAKYADYGFAP